MRLEKLFLDFVILRIGFWFYWIPSILSDNLLFVFLFLFLLFAYWLFTMPLDCTSLHTFFIFYVLSAFVRCTFFLVFFVLLPMPSDCTSFQLFCFSALSFWSFTILLYRPIGPYLISMNFAFQLLLGLAYCPIGLYLLFLDFLVRIFLFSYLFCLSLFVSLI